MDEFYFEFEEDFARISAKQNWPGSGLDDDDIVQLIWEDLLVHWDKVSMWGRGLILVHARRTAVKLNRSARSEYLQNRGGWIYDRDAVDQALYYSIWDPESRLPDHETQIDLSRAVASLPTKQWDAVYRHYAENEEFESKSLDERNFYRGMERIVEFMNLNTVSGEVPFEDLEVAVDMGGRRTSEVDQWQM